MAGPSIMVRVLGDTSGLAKSFKDTGDKAASVAKTAQSAFSTMLGTLNRTGVLGPFGEALAVVDEGLGNILEHGKKVSDVLLGAGGAVAGVGVLLTTLGSKEQAAHQQLAQAIDNTGHSYDDYAKAIETAIKHNEKFGQSSAATQNALQILTQATGDPAKALHLLSTATDLAAAKHEDLASAATSLGKVYNGNTRLLKEFGITVTKTVDPTKGLEKATRTAQAADRAAAAAKQRLADVEALDAGKKKLTTAEAIRLRDAEQKVRDAAAVARDAHQKLAAAQDAARNASKKHESATDELAAKLHGQAAASADTFTGRLKAISTTIEDQVAQFGQKYGPALQGAGAAMVGLGGFAKIAKAGMDVLKDSTLVQTAATYAWVAAETVAEAAGLPLIATVGLIVVAVAGLIAIAYVLYRNWSTIWGAMKVAAKAVWDWIRVNWPLLLGILLGPIGIAAALIYRYWNQILGGIQVVWRWIVANWPYLLGVLLGPIGVAAGLVIKHWNTVVGFFQRIPGWIASAFSDLTRVIAQPFEDALGIVKRVWDDTVGALKVPGGIVGKVLGKVASVIPGLDTGGYISQTGLAVVHQGETVIPAAQATPGRAGPAIVINDAHFASDLDLETFMRKAAWHIQTQRV
jgi:hypothetical protein